MLTAALHGCNAGRRSTGSIDLGNDNSPMGRLAQALHKKDLPSAEKIWLDNQTIFLETPDALTDIEKMAAKIEEEFEPEIKAATINVDSVTWPAPKAQWPLMRMKLSKAQILVDKLQSSVFLQDLGKVPQSLGPLATKLAAKNKEIAADAASYFHKHPVLTGPNFFKTYPARLDEKEFLLSQSKFLLEKVASATGTGIPHLLKTYGKSIPDQTMHAMENQYFRNILRRNSGNKTPSLRAIVKAINDARAMGFPITEVPDCKIAFVRVTSKTMLNDEGIEFGLGFDVDLPVKTEQSKSAGMFSSSTAKDADVVILINETVSKLDRKSRQYTPKTSRYLSGYREIYNPEYDKARLELDNLRNRRSDAMGTVNTSMLLGVAGIFTGLAAASEADHLEAQINELSANATNIPRMIDKPVYTDYKYRVIGIKDTKVASVQYFIIDRRAGTYFEDVFDIVHQKDFKVAYGVKEKDPKAAEILTSFMTEKDLRNWEKQPVEVKLSDLLTHYLKHKELDKKYRSMAEVRKKIMNKRNEALKQFYANKYSSDTGNDPRFDSVVVIQSPSGSLGSGFFVTDNIVITNMHVVEGSDYAEMKMHNGMETFGKVLATDPFRDLALVKMSTRGKPVRFYNKNSIPSGVTLEAIGHPHGYQYTITRGVFSAYRQLRSHMVASKDRKIRYIQTDAAINPGNSGGPLFYKDRLVGVNSWGRVDPGTANLNFAVHYSEVIDFLKQYGIHYRN